eukprot:TRINITY_DN15047_c0_g5_i1.p1 TRINITY_DN15047_c0_g5~~TRINITY_DN15047_c0_g5_i1.p1  ORF type:complete len:422 (-),score=47.66 TRINITY_DN15047_c0_g5_i1:194-1459(-)
MAQSGGMRQRGTTVYHEESVPLTDGRSSDQCTAGGSGACDGPCDKHPRKCLPAVPSPPAVNVCSGERCQRSLVSRQFKMLSVLTVTLVPLNAILFSVPRSLQMIRCPPSLWTMHYAFVAWVSFCFVYNFAMAAFVDPGNCQDMKPDKETTGQFRVTLNTPSAEQLFYAPSWCVRSKTYKPPRSHYCSSLKRCVPRMDHQCPFLGNCIGLHNHGYFFLMYVYALVGLAYSACLLFFVLRSPAAGAWRGAMPEAPGMDDPIRLFSDMELLRSMLHHLILHVVQHAPRAIFHTLGASILLQMLMTFVGAICMVSMGIPALLLALRGITALEAMFPWKENVEIKAGYWPVPPGFYSKRWWRNLGEILGARAWLRILVPFCVSSRSISSIAKPGPEGEAWLLHAARKADAEGESNAHAAQVHVQTS